MHIRDRVVKMVRVRADKIRPCPWNFRTHPEEQKKVLRAVFREVGLAGACLVRELEDGTYMLIDGHLRREELAGRKIPAIVVDLDESEAKKLLACYDPLGDLAMADKEALGRLLKDVDTDEECLSSLFSGLMKGGEQKELAISGDDDGEEVGGEGEYNYSPSQVRMVQLFLNTTTVKEFEKLVSSLGELYGTQSLTETVMEALRRASKKAAKRSSGR